MLMMGFGVLGYLFKKLALSAGAAGARHRDRRQGRGRLSPVDADVAGLARHLLRQRAGDDAGAARRGAARWCATAFQAVGRLRTRPPLKAGDST